MSIIPLIHYYENNKSIDQILITSSTLSSSNILRKYKFKKTVHQFFPIDFFFISKKFLSYWKPSLAVFIDSEIWPCFFHIINKKKIPLILLNARITKKTFDRWNRFKKFAKSVFKNIICSFPQNKESINYLKKLKIKNINFIGNLKFINNPFYKKNKIEKQLQKKLKKYKIWTAASTHKGEEMICAEAHKILKKNYKNLITIIIPRHISRKNEIISELKNLGLNIITHSSKIKKFKNVDIYLVDTFGESEKFYMISKTVFLGKSLTVKGGQNPLEAARYGAKILHGNNVQNFPDIYKYLNLLKISTTVKNSDQIASSVTFKSIKNKNNNLKYLSKNILQKTTAKLNKFLIYENEKT